MFDWRRASEWWTLFRYYQVGLVNLGFGYVVFAALLAVGLSAFLAQAVGHVIGMGFNYFTYSRYVFSKCKGSKGRFFLSYGLNYVLGVAALWLALRVHSSPYAAGLAATIAVSFINFFVLKRLVYSAPAKQ